MGFLIADFLAGFLHWFEDTYMDYCMNTGIPLIDQISQENELHHYFPRTILASSDLESMQITGPGFLLILF